MHGRKYKLMNKAVEKGFNTGMKPQQTVINNNNNNAFQLMMSWVHAEQVLSLQSSLSQRMWTHIV